MCIGSDRRFDTTWFYLQRSLQALIGIYRRFGTTSRSHLPEYLRNVYWYRQTFRHHLLVSSSTVVTSIDWYLPTFRNNLSLPSSRVLTQCVLVATDVSTPPIGVINGRYRHWLVFADVSEPLAPIFQSPYAVCIGSDRRFDTAYWCHLQRSLHSIDWYLLAFWDNLSISFLLGMLDPWKLDR